MYDKSQDNFSTALLTIVTTVVGVRWKEKKKAGYRSVVVSTHCRGVAPIAESKEKTIFETQPQHHLFPRHTFYKSHGQAKTRIAPGVPLPTSLPCDHV
jgi:hypothetical protein